MWRFQRYVTHFYLLFLLGIGATCLLTTSQARRPQAQVSSDPSEGTFFTAVPGEEFVDGALALGHSLRSLSACKNTTSRCQLRALVSSSVSEWSQQRLRVVGWEPAVSNFSSVIRNDRPKFARVRLLHLLLAHAGPLPRRVAFLSPNVIVLHSAEVLWLLESTAVAGNAPCIAAPAGDADAFVMFPGTASFRIALQSYATATWTQQNGKQIPINDQVAHFERFFSACTVSLPSSIFASSIQPAQDIDKLHFFAFNRPGWSPWDRKRDRTGLRPFEVGFAYRAWWSTYEELHSLHYSKQEAHVPQWGGTAAHGLPVAPTSQTHVWMQRRTGKEYVQLLSKEVIRLKNQSIPGLEVHLGSLGRNCQDVCTALETPRLCAQNLLSSPAINNCSTVGLLRGECNGCLETKADAAWPAVDSSGLCLVNHRYYLPVLADCSVSSPGLQRVCPCVAVTDLRSNQLPFLGWTVVPGGGFAPRHLRVEVAAPEVKDERPNNLEPENPATDWPSNLPCDPRSTDFTEETDHMCSEYLKNLVNMRAIRPMVSIFAYARTIKFKVKYNEPHIKALLKVPQNKFPFEPYSEYISYLVDRALGMNRVPPTAWVTLPVSMLESAASQHTDPNYLKWVTESVFSYHEVKRGYTHQDGKDWIGVSIQLWLSDIHAQEDTDWVMHHGWKSWFSANHPLNAVPHHLRPMLPQLSDIVVFDYVIANLDRRRGKNYYVAGGCRVDCNENEPKHIGDTSLVFLDQGSSFYHDKGPDGNPLTGDSDFCRFRRKTLAKLRQLKSRSPNSNRPGPSLYEIITQKSPQIALHVIESQRIQWAQDRLDEIVHHVDTKCSHVADTELTPWE
eukprot:TRINITY_DN8436_c0_g1_i1.p1 TRINITY_DN8436_c0_g1~~TRINITY_DN8436_c0_g1_i1.p1  ORF type:complete len:843 (-),score=51.11 TRINITY_DN8436_c0_g1_i1:20-2548(-)